MGETLAIPGFGTTLSRDGHLIAEILNIGGPTKTRDTIDASNFDSDDQYREFIPGMKDGGEVTFDCNFIAGDTDGQAALDTDYENGTKQSFVVTLVDGTTWTFKALVTRLEPSIPFDGKVGLAVTLKVTGKPALGITLSANITALTYEDSVGAKTSLPTFAAGTYGPYTLTVDTASGYVLVTVTQATAVTILAQATLAGVEGPEHNLTTTVQSGQIAIGAAGTSTLLKITVTDSGKSPKTYTVYVVRP